MEDTNNSWEPTASFETLKHRAQLYQKIRVFFAERNVLEVETQLLSQHSVTDVHIESFSTNYKFGNQQQTYYLQTSPEYAMKRLLAAGSGPIFQICKAFRNGEAGSQHNPEFTMLEWYRPGFNHHDLMDEMDEFLQEILKCKPAQRSSYQDLFEKYFNLNVLQCALIELQNTIKAKNISLTSDINKLDYNSCLEILLTHVIEPNLGIEEPFFVYDFPISQAALAKIRDDDPPVAERFEVYINGVECANGFHELTDANEQQQRFINDQQQRKKNNNLIPEIDHRFLAALQHGLPNCAGIAVGLDRLLMLPNTINNIQEVISFPWDRA